MNDDFIRILQNVQVILNDIDYQLNEISISEEINKKITDVNSLLNFDINLLKDVSFVSKEKQGHILYTLKQANFLLIECSDITDLTNQPQFKLVMEELNKIVLYLQNVCREIPNKKEKLIQEKIIIEKFTKSFSGRGFIADYSDFEELYSLLKEYDTSEADMYIILNSLLQFNINLYMESSKKEVAVEEKNIVEEVVQDEPVNIEEQNEEIEETIDEEKDIKEDITPKKIDIEEILPDCGIYYEACNIIAEKNDLLHSALKEFKSEKSLLTSYYNVYKQGVITDIPNDYLEKVLLVHINKHLMLIDEDLNNSGEYVELYIEEISEALKLYKSFYDIKIDYDKSDDKVNDLIFLNNVQDEFNSNQLREKFFRNQIVSGLSELANNDFRNTKDYGGQYGFYRKVKGGPGGRGGVRIGYIPLSNNIILVLSVFAKQDEYTHLESLYLNNKDLIEKLKQLSKNPNNREMILNLAVGKISSQEFRNEVYNLIDEMNKKRKGGAKLG